jgi:predicted nucleic acid-binding protein
VSPALVLDASVALSWAFEDEASEYTEAALKATSREGAVVPGLWLLEVANGLLVAERWGRLTEADTVAFLSLLRQLPIEVEPDAPDEVFSEVLALARAHGLSLYDAAYLHAAMRYALPLATRDESLREAARRVGVDLSLPGHHAG